MLRRVRLGGLDAEAARQVIKHQTHGATLSASRGVKRVGITTFLGATLRENIPFSPRRRPGSHKRVSSREALRRGRQCHRLVESFVESGTVPAAVTARRGDADLPKLWTRSIIRVLLEANIEPLRAEVSLDNLAEAGRRKLPAGLCYQWASAANRPNLC